MTCLFEQIAGGDIDLSPTCIGHLWIFQNLEAGEIKALSREALRKRSTAGQALFLQGDPADEMFLIKGGRVKLSKVLEDGTELTLDIRKAGDVVGENMFSEEGQCPVSAYCLFQIVPKVFVAQSIRPDLLEPIVHYVNRLMVETHALPQNDQETHRRLCLNAQCLHILSGRTQRHGHGAGLHPGSGSEYFGRHRWLIPD